MQDQHSVEYTLKAATQQLQMSGCPSPSLDAAVLLCHTLNKPRSFLFTWPDKILQTEQLAKFYQLIERRLTGEPIAYITGEREFWSLALKVSPATLIPRADTERLVEIALDKAQVIQGDILDLGTGTGAIALALASQLPLRNICGVDLTTEVQQLAQSNANALELTNVKFVVGSWFEPIENGTKFAIIVSNPPYIEQQDPHLTQGDVRFEPLSALVAKDKGLADIKHIATQARDYLMDHGWIMFEHGFEQGAAVRELLLSLDYDQVDTYKDYGGNDRVTIGQYHQQNKRE